MSRGTKNALRGLVVLSALVVVLFMAGCDLGVAKPEKDGTGSLAITIDRARDAPDYHTPLDWWTANHPHAIGDGTFSERECMLCHVPEDSCNKCHDYVGVKQVHADGR